MQKNLCFVLSLTFTWICVDSRPVTYDELKADLSGLPYGIEEEDLDELSKILDADYDSDETTTPVKSSGTKKQKATSQGVKGKLNVKDLKKLFNLKGAHDQGNIDDEVTYADSEAFVGQAVGVTGNEDRKYKKGTKSRESHKVHHKDEYKKDKVVYVDDETSGDIKKVGAKGFGYEIGAGNGFNKGHFHHDRSKGVVGQRGYSNKGSVEKDVDAFKNAAGFDEAFQSGS